MVQLYLYRLYPRIHGKNYLYARDAFIFCFFLKTDAEKIGRKNVVDLLGSDGYQK